MRGPTSTFGTSKWSTAPKSRTSSAEIQNRFTILHILVSDSTRIKAEHDYWVEFNEKVQTHTGF